MARARNIKPGFFMNEHLVEMPFETRLLFIGLWTLADREGRLEDRPRKIRVELFPYDQLDVDAMLTDLQQKEFLVRYEVDGIRFIHITNFVKHQDPHYKERASVIPPPPGLENKIVANGVTRTQRARIFERDGYKCQSCGASEHLCIDHILPVSRGGDSSDENLQALCATCNTKKGNKLSGEAKNRTRRPVAALPGPEDSDDVQGQPDVGPTLDRRRVDASALFPLIPDSLIPDSLIPDSLIPDSPSLIPDSGFPLPEPPATPPVPLSADPPQATGSSPPARKRQPRTGLLALVDPKPEPPTNAPWQAYAEAYKRRYGEPPVRNGRTNGQMAQVVRLLGSDDATRVAGWFPRHTNRWYVEKGHSLDCLVRDAEKLRTECVTGQQVTATRAAQVDRTQSNFDAAQEALRNLSAKYPERFAQ